MDSEQDSIATIAGTAGKPTLLGLGYQIETVRRLSEALELACEGARTNDRDDTLTDDALTGLIELAMILSGQAKKLRDDFENCF